MLLVLAGCATTPSLPPRNQQVTRAREALLRRADADSLAAAAMMAPGGPSWVTVDPTAALSTIGRAAKLAPQRPDLALLHLAVCTHRIECDPRPLEMRLLALDPANGVPWVGALSRASSSGRANDREHALAELGRASRFDFYGNTLYARLASAAIKTKLIDPDLAVAAVGNGLTRAGVFGFGPMGFGAVIDACKTDSVQSETMISCLKIAKALRRSDDVVTELLGDSMTLSLYDPASPEARSAVESRRLLDYRTSIMRMPTDLSAAATYKTVRRMAKYPRQQDSLLAEIREAGKNPIPPPDWTPSSKASTPTSACKRPSGCPSATIAVEVSP